MVYLDMLVKIYAVTMYHSCVLQKKVAIVLSP